MPRVAVVLGSRSDEEAGNQIVGLLKKYGIKCELKIISAHRNPEELDAFVRSSQAEVFIAVAGLSAALPGVIASKTVKPVIGMPRDVKLRGLDALLSMVQMPPGVPVATVGIDNWKNAALLAIEILSVKHRGLRDRLREERGKR